MKKRIEVTGAVIVKDGKVLAAQRGEGKSLAGYWEFPGGKIESGETPEESLKRELKEELLCDAVVGKHVVTTEYEYDFAIIVLSTFWCALEAGEPTLTEHAQIRWLTGQEMSELNWAPADIPAVEIISREL
ncbi:(deoxy)nucleoside triphosphate pyrophosphohydrolase [Corynebacterium epidermidicanis]|uniref:8-oxo-dGTP diphosphatase n=1 Tax=Corynebacterium epidermidicanis TaxID=1050174 RepID=A0A0G3GNP0_9CORY|nr:(deoxy)nucleoside triphosphate pyrophosphohydrolase [Corynebacterium epidermidicanis]AKK02846.1 ADP-ribose pyrophosphatase [Corynebacterium epidermidicanis]